MKALIWKEWRETLPWAVFALLGLCLIDCLVGLNWRHNPAWLLPQDAFTIWTPMLSALIAGALGFLQITKEQRRDQWAFFIHRPASSSTLFWSKVIAGLTLYGAVMLISTLLFAWWLATPGHIPAPFRWEMILGPVADILAGVLFYFAGMITALRPARWYATKAFPFAAAIFGAIVGMLCAQFWQAALCASLFAALLAGAAWAAFLRQGHYDSQPKFARLLTALSMLLACEVVLWIGIYSISAMLGELGPTYYIFTEDGQKVAVVGDNRPSTVPKYPSRAEEHGGRRTSP